MSWTYSNEHMKPLYLGLSFTFFFLRHDRSPRTQPSFGAVHAWGVKQKPEAFSHEILRHLHFAIMWLVCSTKCKQITNTKGKECGSVVGSRILRDIPKNGCGGVFEFLSVWSDVLRQTSDPIELPVDYEYDSLLELFRYM